MDLRKHNLESYWLDTEATRNTKKEDWRKVVYDNVERISEEGRSSRMHSLSSVSNYLQVKSWSRNTKKYSAFTGEVDQHGAYVPEPYLDRRDDLQGTKLKTMCRGNFLPLLDRVGREAGWPKSSRACPCCNDRRVETVMHLLLECERYEVYRTSMMQAIANSLLTLGIRAHTLSRHELMYVILGARTGDPEVDGWIDVSVTRFLRKAWGSRAPITTSINAVMGRNDKTKL